jgi:hypothetical protein
VYHWLLLRHELEKHVVALGLVEIEKMGLKLILGLDRDRCKRFGTFLARASMAAVVVSLVFPGAND